MDIQEITSQNITILYSYLKFRKNEMIPFHEVDINAFTKSILNETSESEQVFRECHTLVSYDSHGVITACISYGIPLYEINYDGERIPTTTVGAIRYFNYAFAHGDQGKALYNYALSFFKENNISKIYAFSNDYAFQVFGGIGKLDTSLYHLSFFFKRNGYKFSDISSLYYVNLHQLKPYSFEDHIYFKQEDLIDNHQFFTIYKSNVEIGGIDIIYINTTCIVINYIYILDDFRGRSWGKQSLLNFLQVVKDLHYETVYIEAIEEDSILLKLLSSCNFKKKTKGYSLIKEIKK